MPTGAAEAIAAAILGAAVFVGYRIANALAVKGKPRGVRVLAGVAGAAGVLLASIVVGGVLGYALEG